jgi:hypothetical protein
VFSIKKSPLGTTCRSEEFKDLDGAPSAKEKLKIEHTFSSSILSPNRYGKT